MVCTSNVKVIKLKVIRWNAHYMYVYISLSSVNWKKIVHNVNNNHDKHNNNNNKHDLTLDLLIKSCVQG